MTSPIPSCTGASGRCAYWILATFLLCLSCSSRRIARELGVHSPDQLSLVLVAAQCGRVL